jgi:hypothetical protein
VRQRHDVRAQVREHWLLLVEQRQVVLLLMLLLWR